ncbi:MAG: T9SS type A sorting domain-containing protein, partial [Bacteroidota bacterium]
ETNMLLQLLDSDSAPTPIQIQIAPNPSHGWVQISLEKGQLKHLRLVNMQGQLLVQQRLELSPSPIELQLGDFPAGIYFLELEMENGQIQQEKLILVD